MNMTTFRLLWGILISSISFLSKASNIESASLSFYEYDSVDVHIEKRLIKTEVQVADSPISLPTDSTTNISTNPSVLYKEMIYPSSNCRYAGCSDWGGFSICHFLVTPFIYDAPNKKLYFIDKMTIEVTTTATKDRDNDYLLIIGVKAENQKS